MSNKTKRTAWVSLFSTVGLVLIADEVRSFVGGQHGALHILLGVGKIALYSVLVAAEWVRYVSADHRQ